MNKQPNDMQWVTIQCPLNETNAVCLSSDGTSKSGKPVHVTIRFHDQSYIERAIDSKKLMKFIFENCEDERNG